MKTLAQILTNTRVDPSTGCRIWLGATSGGGYGRVWWQGKMHQVHRLVWELLHGDPGTLKVLHTCDNEPCCEPVHLFLGTQIDNMRDCLAKGRWPHRLTETQVVEIKKLLVAGRTQKQLACAFGVHHTTISQIARGKIWKHVR